MNSKKKNKNRQNKPPNPTPPQKKEVSETLSPPVVTNTEVESVVEERVPNIVSENVIAEAKESEEIPKKPKRNRGKKKKEDEKSNLEEEVRIEEPILDTGSQSLNSPLNEANITPTARKKKNKNKKIQGQGDNIEETEIKKNVLLDDKRDQSQETTEVKIVESESEVKSGKKKNKKKKNRNDSEKSDKADEVSCTSAFQKLLEDDGKAKTITQPSTDDSSIPGATVKEAEMIPRANTSIPTDVKPQETLQKEECNKNKKKNKKDKKQPSVLDVLNSADQSQSFEIKAVENISMPSNVLETTTKTIAQDTTETCLSEAIPSTSTADEQNLKQKVKIVKPVEKKKKGKVYEKITEENLEKEPLEVKNENVEQVQVTEMEAKQEPSITESGDLDDIILVPLTELTPDWQEEVKIKEGNGPVIGCDDNNETVAREQPMSSHEKNKNRKKSPKPQKKTEMLASSNVLPMTHQFEETLQEASSSSNKQMIQKSDTKFDISPEIKPKKTDKAEHIQVTTDTENINTKITSPKPLKKKYLAPTAEHTTETLCQIPTSSNQFEKKQGNQVEFKTEENVPFSNDKNELVKTASSNKRNNRKKSPKPPTNQEITENPVILSEQSEITHTPRTDLPEEISVPDMLALKTEELPELKQDVPVETTKLQKDDIERINMPDGEKRQKSKKSPKPNINVASSSRCTQESTQNVLNIEDIIIIQAEVVSQEKAQNSDTFIAVKNLTDSDKQETVQKMDFRHDSEKTKKRKKSPKPSHKDNKDIKENTEKAYILTQGEIQMPITPITQDKTLLKTFAVELETPKPIPMPSPSDVTPDFIEYPRCSSEHHDNNNNMIIQDISHSEAKLEVPLVIPDTPFIQSTNFNSPDLTSAVKVTDIKSENKPREEKTDLKSKVMEVNQDMEELRLSIERSLAEFTSLDKIDKDNEDKNKEKNTENIEKPIEMVDDCIQPVAEVKPCQEPVCPARKDHKGKGKSKKKGKQESATQNAPTQSSSQSTTGSEKSTQSQDTKKDDTNKTEQKSGDAHGKEKQQSAEAKGNKDDDLNPNDVNEKNDHQDFKPIENFEDAMTSSVDDVNKTFEMIVNEVNPTLNTTHNHPEINVIAPQEDDKHSRQDKQNPVSPPKNLLGHPDIPVPSSRTDYKKEKNKPPNDRQAKVKIKDANHVQIEIPDKSKESKESQTESKRKSINYENPDESICVTNQNDDYVYKYSFRKVFLQCACHVCKKDLKQARVPCSYCNLIFYCNQKHKDEDYAQHQALCFAVSTIVHLKDQKFIYADARDITGYNYRLLRMQMIVSCEKVLKRRLAPWEQEALLYPRMCGYSSCREWIQGKLVDCEGCGQISYCLDHPDHLPKSHSRWCKSYKLYRALVKHQQTRGRLEPKLPTKVTELSPLPDNINEVLAAMYEEKIDMSDIEYAALTQIATAPLTALFCLQHKPNTANGITKKTTLTLHIVGAELQFEADVLNKWEVFLLHLVPYVKELRVVLVGPDLNPSNLPLELLGKIKLCENCCQNKRRVVFGFQDKRTYHEFWASEDFTAPDLVCAFNPSIQRASTYNGKDTWPSTVNCILKLRTPFAITSYTLSELTSDLLRVQECAGVGYNGVLAPKTNSFSSVRPDRNFISDDEAPLLFKNHCVTVVCGV